MRAESLGPRHYGRFAQSPHSEPVIWPRHHSTGLPDRVASGEAWGRLSAHNREVAARATNSRSNMENVVVDADRHLCFAAVCYITVE